MRRFRSLEPWYRLGLLLSPAVVLWLWPPVWYLLFRPPFLSMALISAAAIGGSIAYLFLLLICGDTMRPIRRRWADLRYRWKTRHIDRKMGR